MEFENSPTGFRLETVLGLLRLSRKLSSADRITGAMPHQGMSKKVEMIRYPPLLSS